MTLTGGQRLEVHECAALLETVRIPRAAGGVRRKPRTVVGDKGYNAKALRQYLKDRRIRVVIPRYRHEPPDPKFDRTAYRNRNVIERCVGWLKNFRRLATRFEKYALTFLAVAKLAVIRRLLRLLHSPNRT